MSSEGKGFITEKLTPVLIVASLFLAFAVGVLWQKVSSLEKYQGVNNLPTSAGQQPQGNNDAGPLSGKLSDDQAKNLEEISDKDHIRGAGDPEVYLIEYSDFQCSFCKSFHPTAQRVLEEYKNVAWVYRHFPLEQIHPKAIPAAEASECVASLGGNDAFWRFADLIFSDETYLDNLQSAAEKAGVSATAFKSCFDARKFKSRVESDYQAGVKAGVNGTPANFIVNRKGEVWLIPGALPFDQVKSVIDEALKS